TMIDSGSGSGSGAGSNSSSSSSEKVSASKAASVSSSRSTTGSAAATASTGSSANSISPKSASRSTSSMSEASAEASAAAVASALRPLLPFGGAIGWPGSGSKVRTVSSSTSPAIGSRTYSSARVLSLPCWANTSSATSDAYMISGMYLVSSLRRSLLQI